MKKVKWLPTMDRVIVDVDKAPEPKGIVLPDDVKPERPDTGKVVEVGPGYLAQDGRRYPPAIKVGQRVKLDRARGQEIEYDGVKMVICHEGEVLAVEKLVRRTGA